MPQNYNHKDWQGLKITTCFNSIFRRGVLRRRPYYFGERVWLNVTVEKLKERTPDPSHFEICELTGAGDVNNFGKLAKRGEIWHRLIKSSQLADAGGYKLYLRYPTTSKVVNHPLMTADVVSPDRRDRKLGQMVLAALLGAILGGLGVCFLAVRYGIGV